MVTVICLAVMFCFYAYGIKEEKTSEMLLCLKEALSKFLKKKYSTLTIIVLVSWLLGIFGVLVLKVVYPLTLFLFMLVTLIAMMKDDCNNLGLYIGGLLIGLCGLILMGWISFSSCCGA